MRQERWIEYLTKNLSILSGADLQYSSTILETETVSLDLSQKFLTFTIHSFVLNSIVPLFFPNVEPCIYWSTETIVILKWTLGRGKCTQVNIQDFLRILYTRITTDQSPKWVPKVQASRGCPGVCSLGNFLDVYSPKSPFLGIWVIHKGYLLTVQTTFQISSWEVFCFF